MKTNEETVKVRNFTDQQVCYLIPEKNIRRDFQGFETKELEAGELRELFFKSGGRTILRDYLGVDDQELAAEFGVSEDLFTHEYSWTNEDIKRVLETGSQDELADALDFAPLGIIETLVSMAIDLKIPDINKRKLIQEMTGKDINKMIAYKELLEEPVEETVSSRRRAETVNEAPVQTGRRVR